VSVLAVMPEPDLASAFGFFAPLSIVPAEPDFASAFGFFAPLSIVPADPAGFAPVAPVVVDFDSAFAPFAPLSAVPVVDALDFASDFSDAFGAAGAAFASPLGVVVVAVDSAFFAGALS
jgi:hypothetical protein